MSRLESGWLKDRSIGQQLAVLLLTYSLSRVLLYALADITFDLSGLNRFWQLLDPQFLKDDLISSLFYLHSQPPLFNLFSGVVLKLFPDSYPLVFQACFHLLSLLGYWALYRALILRGVNPSQAFMASTLFIILPSTLLYENWFSYTWVIACLMCYAAYMLAKFQYAGRVCYLLVFFLVLGVICWTRSLFHLVYMVAISVLVIVMVNKTQRLKVVSVAIFVLLLTSTLYVKNLVVFDFFGASSWAGMSFWKMTKCESETFSENQHRLADIEEFSSMRAYEFAFENGWLENPGLSHPALNQIFKSTGAINLNHQGFIPIAREYSHIAMTCLNENPKDYVIRAIGAWGVFSKPSWEYFFLEESRADIEAYLQLTTLQDLRFYIENDVLGLPRKFDFPMSSLLLIPAVYLFVTFVYLLRLFNVVTGKEAKENIIFDTFLVATIWYVGLIGNSMEYGENHRFRVCAGFIIYLATILSASKLRHRIAVFQLKRNTN